MAKTGTETSDFGVSKRENHDSTKFYKSKLYKNIKVNDKQEIVDNSQSIDTKLFNKMLPCTGENLAKIPDHSIHAIFFPVPSLRGVENPDINGFLARINAIVHDVKDKLITGGRVMVMIDNEVDASVSRSGFWPLHAWIAPMFIDQGLYMRGELILTRNQGNGEGEERPCIASSSIPVITSRYSHGLVFSKDVSRRIKKDKKGRFEKTDTVTRDQFLAYTKSVWELLPDLVSNQGLAEKIELERVDFYSRFIHLYSFLEDTILCIASDEDKDSLEIIKSLRKKNISLVVNKFF